MHHAGLLPKYRLLVEKLAQDGLLKIICGTDTLGVGVNVPIRTVLFTQLCKYDGTSVRSLSNREFAQIAGRAGRKGFDDEGTVWVQAPEHVIENLRAEEKAARKEGKKSKKVVKKKPPERGYSHWNEDTFNRIVNGAPEPLISSFSVNHQMVMSLLDRPGDGCAAVRKLMTDNHETKRRGRNHIRRSIAIYRSLVEAELLEFPEEPDEWGRRGRVNFDLQDEFALHQPLSLWAIEAIGQVEEPVEGLELMHALDIVTIVEALMENPGVIVAAQLNKAKDAAMAEMKSSGVEYDERMARLAEVEPPRPNKQWLYDSFDEFREHHPWVGTDNVRPKSIVREMFEEGMTFTEYVQYYGLKRSEGVVLRYLSDVYKGIVQNVPEDSKTDELDDVVAWLGAVIRQVDSSLIDEWDALISGEQPVEAEIRSVDEAEDITSNVRGFRVLVRNEIFRWVQALAIKRHAPILGSITNPDEWTLDDTVDAIAGYWEEHDEILTGGDARSAGRFILDGDSVTQILLDPEGYDEWRIKATIDRELSKEEGRARLRLDSIERI